MQTSVLQYLYDVYYLHLSHVLYNRSSGYSLGLELFHYLRYVAVGYVARAYHASTRVQ